MEQDSTPFKDYYEQLDAYNNALDAESDPLEILLRAEEDEEEFSVA